MLIGVFELLADAQRQIASANGYIESLRDFWLADGDLAMAMLGKSAATPIGQVSARGSAQADRGAGH